MARETTKWPSTRWPITKIMSSDGCNGNRVPLEMGPWYDFREFGCHLGNVGLVYPGFGQIGQGEDFVDGNGNGTYDAGETFTDANANGVWDPDIGVAGPGNAGEVVLYKLQYDWPLLTPLMGSLLSPEGTIPIVASIAVRNEPWDNGSGAAP